jgi:hypothetical protein
MYQLLTGKRPFEGSTKELIAREILDTEPPMPHRIRADVPPALDRICWKLLRKEPAERYQSGEDVSRDLERWANPTRRLQRWTMGALGASLVATLLVMAWVARKEGDRRGQEAAREAVAEVSRVPFQQLPLAVERLETMRTLVNPLLQQAIQTSDIGSEERLRLTLAMLPNEPLLAGDVASQLLKSDAKRIGVLLESLQPHAKQIDDSLWQEAEKGDEQTLLPAAAALARFASASPRWEGIAASVSEAVASQDPEVLGDWLPYLDSVNKQLVPRLLQIGLSPPGSGQPDRRVAATKALERYAANDFKWFEAIFFCRWLSKVAEWKEEEQSYKKRNEAFSIVGWLSAEPDTDWPVVPDRPGFRLPNEREWEIVARSGMMTPYSFGRSDELIEKFGWCLEQSVNRIQPVAMLRPSVGGLFDIHGNVQEWTNDSASSSVERVFRGGAVNTIPSICRSASRSGYMSTSRNGFVGLRVVMNPDSMPDIAASR